MAGQTTVRCELIERDAMSLRRLAPLCAAVTAVAFLAACDPAPEDAGESAATAQVTYTCCSAKDIETPAHPGQTMSIHWAAELPNALSLAHRKSS